MNPADHRMDTIDRSSQMQQNSMLDRSWCPITKMAIEAGSATTTRIHWLGPTPITIKSSNPNLIKGQDY
jgi:hypothetical protein